MDTESSDVLILRAPARAYSCTEQSDTDEQKVAILIPPESVVHILRTTLEMSELIALIFSSVNKKDSDVVLVMKYRIVPFGESTFDAFM